MIITAGSMYALDAADRILLGPYLQAVTMDSVYVLVESGTKSPITVEYGLDALYGREAVTESTETTATLPSTYIHNIKLTGLRPNTWYHYRLTGSDADHAFITAAGPGTDLRLAFAADFRTGLSIHDAIAKRITDAGPRFLIYGGDLCAESGYQSFKNEFFRESERRLISEVPFFNAPGNHEGWTQNTKAFTHAPDSDSGTQGYYSFDYGDLHVLMLNNQLPYWEGSTQYDFAARDLAGTTKTWKIVVAHNPAYCAGGHGDDADMKTMATNIFEPNKVDLVLGGHSHFYQHNLVNGIHHLVIGAAGAPLYEPDRAPYTVKAVKDYNYAIIDATPVTLRIAVYNDRGGILDVIGLSKDQSGAPAMATAPAVVPEQALPSAGGQVFALSALQMDLTSYFNQDAFSYDSNARDGRYDNPPDRIFSCYSADLVKANPVFDGVAYQLGLITDGMNNAVRCEGQTIKLSEGQYAALCFLGAATQGNQTGIFVIDYVDGTRTEVRISQADWCSADTSTQKIVQVMNHRHRDGVDEAINTYIFAYYLTPAAGKVIIGVTLPKNPDMHLLAFSLIPAAPPGM